MKKALYPGTFDPITLGHIDLIERALQLFDEVIVAVASSESKQPAFPQEERILQIQKIFNDKRLSVIGFDGLVVDLAKDQDSMILIRGLRAVSDFEYEFQLASMNREMLPELETVFLTPKSKYSFVSSTLVREIARMGGDVSPFVDASIKKALEERYSK